MKNRNIDDFVKEKLEGYNKSPRPEAWSRLSASLNTGSKKRHRIFLSIAASVTTLLVVAFFIHDYQQGLEGVNKKDLAENDEISPKIENPVKDSISFTNSSNDSNKNSRLQSDTDPVRHKDEPGSKTETDKGDEDVQKPALVTVKNQLAENNRETKVEEKDSNKKEGDIPVNMNNLEVIPVESPLGQLADIEKLPITDSLDSGEIVIEDELFTELETGIAMDESRKENDMNARGFSFKKIIEAAKDLKTDNEAWGSLREAKNELLTFGRSKDEE